MLLAKIQSKCTISSLKRKTFLPESLSIETAAVVAEDHKQRRRKGAL